MSSRRVLIVDDEALIRWSLAERLRADGHQIIEAGTAAEALSHADEGVDLVLLDYRLPDDDGVSVLRRLRDVDPDVLVIMLTAHKSVETVVEAMRAGAFDYATKPFDLDDVALRVSRALETTRLRRELRTLRETLSRPFGLESIIGESEPVHRIKALVRKIATSPGSTVLITGESGTGKDLIAKVIHYASSRAARPFLNITCSALPDTLLESELFGHERGAFTDARQQKRGLLEQADEGTVFLDEIGEMAPQLQAKLLRFLEEKAFRRVGGTGDVHVDVRVIAATNRDLEEAVKAGRFRDDLYYRLNVLRVEVPPLRARGDDVALLAQHFVEGFSREFKRHVRGLSRPAEEALKAYAWPGNVRELRNLVERAVLLCERDRLEPSDFETLTGGRARTGSVHGGFELPPEGVNLEEVEKSLVMQALERTGGNQTRAAALLSLHRDQIRYRVEKFGLKTS
jgi:two-component system, NtrC family, response regulator AtoC